MPTVFISNIAVSLPTTIEAGDILDSDHARFLFAIKAKRVISKLRYLLDRGEIDKQGLQFRADQLMLEPMEPYSVFDEEEGNEDPIMAEALDIAKSMITSRMAQENLPPPKGLDTHAKALVDAMPVIVEKARLRIEARYKAATSLIGNLL